MSSLPHWFNDGHWTSFRGAPHGGPGWRYVYDPLERLIEVRQNGTLIARYAYDVLGRRIVKRVYSSATGGTVAYTRFVYRGSAVAVEADSAGALTLGYTSGLGVDNLVAIRKYSDSTHYYVVQDALHSVRGLSRRDGTWIASWRYAIYGAVLDSAGTAPFALRYRWTGREYDVETGFYYFRARYLDPAAQRFVQEDPIGYAGGANVYAYGDGNPTNGRDPSGLRFSWSIPSKETRDPGWGAWSWVRYEGFLGGDGSFQFADLITSYEAHYTGNLEFKDEESRQAYFELRRAAYNASYSGNQQLMDLISEVSSSHIIIEANPLCSLGCHLRWKSEEMKVDVAYISINPSEFYNRGILPSVGLAHELGHFLAERRPHLRIPVPGTDDLSEYAAIYFENAARAAYGCMGRHYNYNVTAPSC